ncbi:hypothetical protein [Cryptosporangium japonicum]|uniref:ABC transporter permease n=1 Tax=Cryptosporangium japonicum TaxID=80872 RepID=A0ABN0UKS9_9ACTN
MTGALFRSELGRALRNPLLWLVAVAVHAAAVRTRLSGTAAWAPDLTIETVDATGDALFVAAGVLLGANLAILRERRMPERLAALPGRPADRAVAVAGAFAVLGAVVAALQIAAYLVLRIAQGSVGGHLDGFEVACGVTVAALAAPLGVALGRWVPSLVAAPLVLFALMLLTLLNRNLGGFGGWFLPLVLIRTTDGPARPSELHLVYLVAVGVAGVGVALLRHRSRRRGAVLGVVLTALVLGVSTGAAAQARPGPGPDGRAAEGRAGTDCRRIGAVTYCALRGYTGWIPRWAAAVAPIEAALPASARDGLPTIVQHTAGAPGDTTGSVPVWSVWGRGASERPYRDFLAGDVAARATGLDTGERCDASGQARTVVALWLLGQVTGRAAGPATITVTIATTGSGGRTLVTRATPLGVSYGAGEIEHASRLLTMPEAGRRIRAHWSVLVDPATPIARALPLLGLSGHHHDSPLGPPRCA